MYVLSARPVDRSSLPDRLGHIGFAEFHAPRPDPLPLRLEPIAAPQYVAGRPVEIGARVVSDARPDSVIAWVRPMGAGWFRRFPMRPTGAYTYSVAIPSDSLPEGAYRYVISVRQGDSTTTFPDGITRAPWDWDFHIDTFWRMAVIAPNAPLRVFWPAEDAPHLAFTRIGDAGRQGIFRIVPSSGSGEAVLRLTMPVSSSGSSPEDYTASLVIADLVRARGDAMSRATGLRLKIRGVGPRQRMFVTLMEKDGTSWSTAVPLDTSWSEQTIPLPAFRAGRGVKLPQGFPGTWNYWVDPASGRGGPGDVVRPAEIERLQLSLRREAGVKVEPGAYGFELESATFMFR